MRHRQAGQLAAREDDAAPLSQAADAQLQEQGGQLKGLGGTPISHADAVKAGKEVSDAWVIYVPTAIPPSYCLYCMWQMHVQ